MNFQQLRIIRETVRQNYNLTEVANALYTSQSGVSKHIKDLEDELGIELFVRKGKRFLGMTEPGRELARIAERILLDTKNIKQLAAHFSQRDEGRLTIVTTHTQARYALPPVVAQFKREFPKVHLALHQGSPQEIVTMLNQDMADIGLATEALANNENLATFPYYQWRHAVIVPNGHPLASVHPLTLEAIAEYPVVTYHEGMTGRTRVDQAFDRAELAPEIVMSALDSDVIKTYVELGLGIGIIASMAFDPERDAAKLSLLDCSHLFGSNTTSIAVRKGHYLRGFACRFIELCSSELDEETVRSKVALAAGEV
ncbi:MAG: CysB family HTH-type transcriptional regulator [Gallionellaceae bacterium]|nr:CysB family HTH-type transcriptional regulator [Gallionellaceae bacterium]